MARNVMSYVTRVLFFATPVIYPVDAPARLRAAPRRLAAALRALRQLPGRLQWRCRAPRLVVQAALWAAALLVIGGRTFLRHERQFALHL